MTEDDVKAFVAQYPHLAHLFEPVEKEVERATNDVLKQLEEAGYDYSSCREAIARMFDEELLNGHQDNIVEAVIHGMKNLRFIQEDHYDQFMDDDEDKPSWDSMLFYTCIIPAYVWLV